VARHRDEDAPDAKGCRLRMNRWLVDATQELDQIRFGEAALTPAADAMAGEKACIAPPPDRSLADPQEPSRLSSVQ
jgi:hypothetical protein